MGEEETTTPLQSRAAARCSLKSGDQNQPLKSGRGGSSSSSSSSVASTKLRSSPSSWGSHIVRGFSGEKKTKQLLKPASTKKVHPQALCSSNNYNKSMGSRDLLLEVDNLRGFLKESKDREAKLRDELSEWKSKQRNVELERELEAKRTEIDDIVIRVNQLECENKHLLSLTCVSEGKLEEEEEEECKSQCGSAATNLEIEVVRLRRLNKELQLQKRDLTCRVASLESQLSTPANASESDVIAKIKAEASSLRQTNEDLCKQVEGLQSKRLNEVEELAYLRWVNSCLRDELHNSCSSMNPETASTTSHIEDSPTIVPTLESDNFSKSSSVIKCVQIKKPKKFPTTDVNKFTGLESSGNSLHKDFEEAREGKNRPRLTISGRDENIDDVNMKRQPDCSRHSEEEQKGWNKLATAQDMSQVGSLNQTIRILNNVDMEKRELRVPNPPPRSSCPDTNGGQQSGRGRSPIPRPPPPPPPPPRFTTGGSIGTVQRAPEVVELYHSLMKRESRKDSSSGIFCETPTVANVRSSMIGEIENRSSYLLAIKADVETQGEFVNSLIREVNNAVYKDIEDVIAFVKWLDDELCFLVDERAVLKHFDWPEKKADTLREAAFGYKDLKKLELDIVYYTDDPRMPCDSALKKMAALTERMERTVYNLLRSRDSLIRICKEFQIPTEWMLDSGIISKVKLGSVKLAKMYMKRVATELQSRVSSDKDPGMDYMLLQGVRFAFRIHQFAGGFDAETMQAFEELRKLAHAFNER
ncbi:hypothetical protein Dimus_015516 [Dionaea muscipula]